MIGGRWRRWLAVFAVGGLMITGFTALWWTSLPPRATWIAVWELLVGSGFAAAAAVATWHQQARAGSRLATVAAALLTAGVLTAIGPDFAGPAAALVAGFGVTPLCLLRVVRPTPRSGAMLAVEVVLVAAAVTSAVGFVSRSAAVAGWAATAAGAAALCGVWILFEATSGDDRRRVLWLILGTCGTVPLGLLLFLSFSDPLAIMPLSVGLAVLSLGLPFSAAVAAVNPRWLDVRELMRRAAVAAVMLSLVTAVYLGGLAAWRVATGEAMSEMLQALLVGLIGVGFHPVAVRVGVYMDELLFGGRADAVDALTRLGSRLAAGSTPAEWLPTLRVALAVPGLALRDGDEVVATAGRLDGASVITPLRAGAVQVGDLVVGLPENQLRLPPTTAMVVELVAAPLAQALQAIRLAEQLRSSRGEVVAALEEERRRMRRDLHDGLGPTLTGIAYSADAVANLVAADPDQAQALLKELRRDTSEAIAEVRRIVYGLRPKALDELGLVAAIRQRVATLRVADGRGLRVAVTAPTQLPKLPAAVEVATYRVAVEAITNVARHAGVDEATLELSIDPDRGLRLVVGDTGDHIGDWSPGAGLTSMRERAEQIGGELTVAVGRAGARVEAVFPID